MAEIDQHAHAHHLAHHLFAERGQPVVLGRCRGAVGPAGVGRVGERHVARTKVVHLAQHGKAGADRMATLHAQQAGDLALRHRRLDIGRGERQRHVIRIAGDQPLGDVDLLDRRLHGVRLFKAGRHIDRPPLRADLALPQPGEIGVHLVHRPVLAVERIVEIEAFEHVVEAAPQRPGHVVVAIPHRRRLQRCCGDLFRRLRQGGRADGEQRRGKHQAGQGHATSDLVSARITPQPGPCCKAQ